MPVYMKLEKGTNKKKYKAVFSHMKNGKMTKIKSVQFGQAGASDFTKHKDHERKKKYLARHKANENWNSYMTAGALSRWILWNKPTLEGSLKDYKKRFKLK